MKVCEVVGTVTLSQAHPSLKGLRLIVADPIGLDELRRGHGDRAEPIVAVDQLSAGIGSRVGVSEGREAAMAFEPDRKPVDAYCACIVDSLRVDDV